MIVQDNIELGYWPKSIFTHLAEGVSELSFGGITKSSSDGQSPPMGAGTKATRDYERVGFFEEIRIAGSKGDVDLSNYKVFQIVSNESCYDIFDYGNKHGALGNTFSYGGPGGFGCGN